MAVKQLTNFYRLFRCDPPRAQVGESLDGFQDLAIRVRNSLTDLFAREELRLWDLTYKRAAVLTPILLGILGGTSMVVIDVGTVCRFALGYGRLFLNFVTPPTRLTSSNIIVSVSASTGNILATTGVIGHTARAECSIVTGVKAEMCGLSPTLTRCKSASDASFGGTR